ncbi:hypothetical protein F5Y14DRAFT_424102 [Nemania sp. NC0429]|nr:hypothetical protein F5Y14DRAFT_424102 [Nemania sp. NC0429]
MTLADSAIVGIVALLVMSIPGVRYLARMIQRIFNCRQKKSSNRDTVLPLHGYVSPNLEQPEDSGPYMQALSATATNRFGIAQQTIRGDTLQSPIAPTPQGIVAVLTSTVMVWPAINLPAR